MLQYFHSTFSTMHRSQSVNLAEHVCAMKEKYKELDIYVGTDSQNKGKYTTYVSTVVFRFPNNGAHVVYQKHKKPRVQDMWSRLWHETERSVELAQHLEETCGVKVFQIDLDLNEDPKYPSNKVLKAAQGFIESMGFRAKAKPNILMAAWAANALCQ